MPKNSKGCKMGFKPRRAPRILTTKNTKNTKIIFKKSSCSSCSSWLKFWVFSFALILIFVVSVFGQNGEEVIRINSDLVSFEVSVRDNRGVPIRDLKAADFLVYEDGHRQQVA